MTEPQVRYVRSADGVNIAYYEMGEGVPFVSLSIPYSHLHTELRVASMYESIAREARVVLYDPRGFGLSERDIDDFSLPAMVHDLEAVVERLGIPPFVLQANGASASPIALAYAAMHQERVSHLILGNAIAKPELLMVEQISGVLALPGADWRFVSESIARFTQGWDDPDASDELAALLRDSITLESFRLWFEHFVTWDASDLLPTVKARALLTVTSGHGWFGLEQARAMAATMPNARLALIEGRTAAERAEAYVGAIRQFFRVPATQENRLDGAGGDPVRRALPDGLTAREAEVLRLIAGGRSNREISEQLTLSVRTVARHIANIYSKIGTRNKAEATDYAHRRGLT